MKRTKTFFFSRTVNISAYGQNWLERVSNSARRANEAETYTRTSGISLR